MNAETLYYNIECAFDYDAIEFYFMDTDIKNPIRILKNQIQSFIIEKDKETLHIELTNDDLLLLDCSKILYVRFQEPHRWEDAIPLGVN